MSKKIIYLLSLVMALSLVFAGCKKNGVGDVTGTVPNNAFDNSPKTEDGLADSKDWLDQNSEKPIKNEPIPGFQSVGGQAYFRNPVIVVMGTKGSDVVVFGEKRYKSLGADNDIGIDGNTAVDIVCITSQDSGKKWGAVSVVGRTPGETATVDNAVASPVVFKIDDKTVVVVASAGVGLSRTSEDYTTRSAKNQKSKLMYTIGTYASGSFTWGTQWTDMTQKVEEAITSASSTLGNAKQFAVHSGKGVVNEKKLYLAVSVSEQGVNGSGAKENMGNLIMKGDYNNGSITWSVVESTAVKFTSNNTFSDHKESRVIAASGDTKDKIEYIAVGSPYYVNEKMGYGKAGEKPKDNGIPGSEGSPAYLVVKNWQGQQSYDPTQYSTGSAKSQGLFAHVKSKNNTITMYGLEDTGFSQKSGSKTYTVIGYPSDTETLAKSSSMDALGDGTIVMVAEQGGSEKVYNVVYKRFTQKFLATQLGIN